MGKIGVAIMGGSGAVGQQSVKFIPRDHPQLEIKCITGSGSVGMRYGDVKWYADNTGACPENAREMIIEDTSLETVRRHGDIRIVFSDLPAMIAGTLEPELAKAGITVISKASTNRMKPLVPLVVAEINSDHLEILDAQRREMFWEGALVADPNCTTTGLVMVLKPLMDRFGLKRVFVTTMQATSGAGYLGLPPVAIADTIIPFIQGEEEKTESESLKILGKLEEGRITPAKIAVSAMCNRVNVSYGHLESVFIETERHCEVEDVESALAEFRGLPQEMHLHSAPEHPIVVRPEKDRPQPRLDVNESNGMSVVVGRVQKEKTFENGVKLDLLLHNTVRGGGGMGVLNAELMVEKGLIKR